MSRILIALAALCVLPLSAARASGSALEIVYTANSFGTFDPCPG